MILQALEFLTQLGCLLCIVFGIRAAVDSYKCYENNTNYLAAAFFAVAYLFINNAYGQSAMKVDESISMMYRSLHLCLILFLTRVSMEQSQKLRTYCSVNFKKSNFVKTS